MIVESTILHLCLFSYSQHQYILTADDSERDFEGFIEREGHFLKMNIGYPHWNTPSKYLF